VIDTFVQGKLVDVLSDAVEESREEDATGGLRKLEAQVLALLKNT
jgi:hypothetical protein